MNTHKDYIKPMKVKRTMAEIIQGSDEWFACRAGKVTASRVADGAGGGNTVMVIVEYAFCPKLSGSW